MSGSVTRSIALIGLTICSACSGAIVNPSIATLEPVATVRFGLNLAHPYESLPDLPAKATSKYYEYVFNNYGTYAGIFDYPVGTKEIGRIAGIGGQGCTNVLYGYGKHAFWNVGGQALITLYQVPQKKLRTLSSPPGSFPSSCAMSSDGDLAVGILGSSDGGDIVVFKNAEGAGTVIATPLDKEYFDGYDDRGNLFFDGLTAGGAVEIEEIPKGSQRAITIVPSDNILFPGSVQWDGAYLTVLDQYAGIIHQYTISGTKAVLKGNVQLKGAGDCAQTWIAIGVVYCADAGLDRAEVFKYPKGGPAIAVFSGSFDIPLGTVAAQE